MKETEVLELAHKGTFGGIPLNGKLEETHISWVILTEKYAFKIKKPLKQSFLDYSNLELRKLNCERELELNSRYSPIYLSVVPVRNEDGKWSLGGERGKVVDYAVQMKRLVSHKKMDIMLRKNLVSSEQVEALAHVVAEFHQKAEIIQTPFDLQEAKQLFNDLRSVTEYLGEEFGEGSRQLVELAVDKSNEFLVAHANRFQERRQQGFLRDLHGDLHSGNIFLYKTPILFDGIEFDSKFRHTDVLYEVAFLCMDLDVFKKPDFSQRFFKRYNSLFPSLLNSEDEKIFIYFKMLRANVRAKVHALSARQSEELQDRDRHLQEVKKYLVKLRDYLQSL
jgi:uncharacterized protein